jgi:exostosin family protein
VGSTLVYVADVTGEPLVNRPAQRFRELAALGSHQYDLVDDPEGADIILFPQCHMLGSDWRMNAIREHPLTKRFARKTFVYDERDRPWRSFPGAYVSMSAHKFDSRLQRAWGYYGVTEFEHPPHTDADLLFSLIASPSHRCRRALFRLSEPDAIVEEIRGFTFFDPSSPEFEARREHFRRTLLRSRFVLCPRGRGTSSIRLYETLSAGRVPVIISDEWVPPDGPDWSSISIRWQEGRVSGLVDAIRSYDQEWEAMSRAAFDAYETFFAPAVAFDRISGICEELLPAAAAFRPASPWNSAAIAEAVALRTSARAVPLRRIVRRILNQVARRRH